jgi:hypothetical protein
LDFHFIQIKAVLVHPGGSSGFHAPHAKAQFPEGLFEAMGRRFADAPGAHIELADMYFSIQEGAGGHHKLPTGKTTTPLGYHPSDFPSGGIKDEIHRSVLEQVEILLEFQGLFRLDLVAHFIGLGPGSLHRRTLPAIQHPVLNHGFIDEPTHLAAEGVYFPHHVALCQTSHRRVA